MIAIIPARRDSKSLPGKNIMDLLGKPMIAYTIEAAVSSKYIDDVIISTNCKEIERVAKEFGAKSHFLRPEELAQDDSKAIDNYVYTVDRLKKEFNYKINNFIVLQPTSPLRTTMDIDRAVELFVKNNADSVISYTKEYHPVKWHKYINAERKFVNIFEESIENRQEYEVSYFPNGAIYVFDYDLIKNKLYYTDKSYAYVMPRNRSIDIDTLEDFEYLKYLKEKK